MERLQAKRTFGLVYESHLPERVRLRDHHFRAGVRVADRARRDSPVYQVVAIKVRDAIRAFEGGKVTPLFTSCGETFV